MQVVEDDGELQEPAARRRTLSRRRVIGLATGGAGAAAGVGVGLALGSSDAAASETLVLEVACLGDTFRWLPVPSLQGIVTGDPDGLDPGDLRGTPFSVEGLMYPAGTIAGDGFVPTTDDALGHWFCRGHLVLNPQRPAPHLMSHHEYVFGLITADMLFPRDMMASVGLESSDERVQSGMRAVNGGSGRYRAATGQVEQIDISVNSTVLFGSDDLAPNFRFEFDLLIP